jgi:hypothetical protein
LYLTDVSDCIVEDGATYEQWLNLMPKAKRTEGSIHLILKYIPNATENFIVQGYLSLSLSLSLSSVLTLLFSHSIGF